MTSRKLDRPGSREPGQLDFLQLGFLGPDIGQICWSKPTCISLPMVSPRVVSVSLRARGIASINTVKVLNFYNQAALLLTACYDAPASFFLTLFHLSWSSWLSICITIIVAGVDLSYNSWISGQFNARIRKLSDDAVLDGGTSVFIHVLFVGGLLFPLGVLLTMTLRRRDAALSTLAALKSYVVSLCLSTIDSDAIRDKTFTLLGDLHAYLSHRRPNAAHFFLPYATSATNTSPGSETLITMTREIGLLVRKVHSGVRDLHLSLRSLKSTPTSSEPHGCSEAHYHHLLSLVTHIHQSIEEIAAIKEYRTPATLRALVHWMTIIIYPVFMGFAYQNAYIVTSLGVMLGFLFVFIQISALTIHDTTRGMEDVFNDSALDTISLFEVMDHLSRMTSLVEDGEEEEEEEEEATRGRKPNVSNNKPTGKVLKEAEMEGDAEEGRMAGEGNVRIGIVRMGDHHETELSQGTDKQTKGKSQLKVTQYKGGKHPPLPMPPLPSAAYVFGPAAGSQL